MNRLPTKNELVEVCFIWSLALFPIYFISREQLVYLLSPEHSLLITAPLKLFLWGGGMSSLVVWILMLVAAFKNRQWAWFLGQSLTGFFGSGLYYWLEYRVSNNKEV